MAAPVIIVRENLDNFPFSSNLQIGRVVLKRLRNNLIALMVRDKRRFIIGALPYDEGADDDNYECQEFLQGKPRSSGSRASSAVRTPYSLKRQAGSKSICHPNGPEKRCFRAANATPADWSAPQNLDDLPPLYRSSFGDQTNWGCR